ncbi:monocarboxylate transporter 12-B [Pleuronectes platessa]|uniref:monocarboxylate transporter 12-B n=1 Tax=Pleuronectes platessa TaxID=8262 RepID=UPI00232A3138|nr:monocarboxylate transporter 12-B [Pleuronectes platessa]
MLLVLLLPLVQALMLVPDVPLGVNTSQDEASHLPSAEELNLSLNLNQNQDQDQRSPAQSEAAVMVDVKQRSSEGSPPDGGWGWVIVGSCFMVTVCTRAVTRCISIFFTELQAHFGADYSETAWIHSLLDCTTMLFAPVGSLIGTRWSCRGTVMLGGLISSCGLLLSSFTSSLELLYVFMGVLTGQHVHTCPHRSSQVLTGQHVYTGPHRSSHVNMSTQVLTCQHVHTGPHMSSQVITGLGFALCYTPAIALVGCYFRRRRALAYGVAVSGSGIGTFVLAPAVQRLIQRYTWRGALLVLSAFVANLCVCGALLRPITLRGEEADSEGEDRRGPVSPQDAQLAVKRSHQSAGGCSSLGASPSPSSSPSLPLLPGNPAPQVERRRCFSSWSSREYRFLLLPDFLLLAVSFLFLAGGCSLPFVFLVPCALHAGVSHQHAAFLMSILGVVDIVGNITFGWLTDHRCLKPYRLTCYILSVAMEGLCCLLVPLLRSFPVLVPFAVLYGYFDGAYVALIPVVTSDVVGAQHLSSALGVVYFLHALPYLVSPPFAGWLVDITGSYTATFLLSGSAQLASALILCTAAGIRCCLHHPPAHKE